MQSLIFLWILSLLTLPLLSDDPARAQDATPSARNFPNVPRIHAPYIPDTSPNAPDPVRFAETAIFWFGQVNNDDNYTDVRIGYTDDLLYIYFAVFDREMWYDPNASDADALVNWDAVTVYLVPGQVAQRYRFVAQANANPWMDDAPYQAAWQGNQAGWQLVDIPFSAETGWRASPNDADSDDRGWAITMKIPFAGLGLDSPPAPNTPWRIGIAGHDRDLAAAPAAATQEWPPSFADQDPTTWGELYFGVPTYTAPTVTTPQDLTIYEGADGASVPDAAVGGGAMCGDGYDFWTEWGNANFAGNTDVNIQNQSDVADWPCFSKYYVTFPLDQLPSEQGIVSATLTMHLFGNAGGGTWGDPLPSLIQVGTADRAWDETTLTWNNAPYLLENVSSTWVSRVAEFPGWPGIPYQWDVSSAADDAYRRGIPLRLVLYSSDSQYHSGKYFVSSDTGDWNEVGRPRLNVVYGAVDDAQPTPTATASPIATSTPQPQDTPDASPFDYQLYLPGLKAN